jgi:SAM-dependent methyltransferase
MMKNNNTKAKDHFDKIAPNRLKWIKRNWFYNQYLHQHFSFLIPPHARVLELGCGTGDLLNAVRPSYGVGIDFSPGMIAIASEQFPHLTFLEADAEEQAPEGTFDYIIISDFFHTSWDVQHALRSIKKCLRDDTRIVISNYSYLWEPILRSAERLGLKQKDPPANWLSHNDIFNLLEVEGLQVIRHERKILLPKYVPLLSFLLNKILANLPVLNSLCLVNFIIARPVAADTGPYSVSIIIPAQNERGNIENAIKRTPAFGLSQQFIFVEGNSSDNTFEEMLQVKQKYSDKDITVMRQSGKGKGNAVREGFEVATGDVLMILDADLTTPPEDMPKFYEALASKRGEFINGCRLVYPMEKEAMRLLNLLANRCFSWMFSYLLGQHVKDTLCGTKVLFRSDYNKIKANRSYFGDFDPFGDFDLLFGASKLNLRIVEIYIRYKDREYGSTQISRFKHGWLLLKMTWFAAWKIKFL